MDELRNENENKIGMRNINKHFEIKLHLYIL